MKSQIINDESLNHRVGIYEYFNDEFLRVNGTINEPWFNAKDVATILGYVNTKQAIIKNVDNEDKITFQKLGSMGETPTISSHNSIWINESGLYSLILRSKKKEAKQFKRWVTSEVLPSIRKNGSYEIPEDKKMNRKQQQIDETKDIIELFDKIHTAHLSDRDRLLFLDYSRNLFLDAGSNLLSLKSDNQEWSISRRLTDQYGVKQTKEIKNKTITFGKVLSKQYRSIHNTSPPKREQFVDGTVRSINCYFEKDWVEFGDDLLEEYFKDWLVYEDEDEDEEKDEEKEKDSY